MTAVTCGRDSSTAVPYHTIPVIPMKQPIPAKFCFCLPLSTGRMIASYLNLIFNIFLTIALCAFIFKVGIIHRVSHSDASTSSKLDKDAPELPENVGYAFLGQLEILLLVNLIVNAVWISINVACLCGWHKKRPGLVKLYVSFASFRLALTLTGFLYLGMTSIAYTQTTLTYSIDLGLTAYFILVYYIYLMQLEQDLIAIKINFKENPSPIVRGPSTSPSEKVINSDFIQRVVG